MVAREITSLAAASTHAAMAKLFDQVLVVNPTTVSRHRVVPLPTCPVCGGASALVETGGRRLPAQYSAADTSTTLLGWVDPVTGIIPALVPHPIRAPDLIPVVVAALPPHVAEEDGTLHELPAGWGKGRSVSDAILSAVGEAIERYSASIPDPDRIVWKRPDELTEERLDPRSFSLYSDAQYARPGFPYRRFDPSIRHPWIRGRWLDTGAEVWVPAALAYLRLTMKPEHAFCQGTSSGLAASTDPDDAALRATLELVERDALLAAWLTGCPATRIRLDGSLEPSLGACIGELERLGATVELYALSTAACGTCVMALAVGDGEQWPAVTLGLGADLDPRIAVRQALLELGQTGPYLQRLLRTTAMEVPRTPDAVTRMLDHAAFYFLAEHATAYDCLRTGGGTVDLASLQPRGRRSLMACRAALTTAEVRVALVDVTSPDVATGPFWVVRAVSPDLQALSFGHGLERTPVARLRPQVSSSRLGSIQPIW